MIDIVLIVKVQNHQESLSDCEEIFSLESLKQKYNSNIDWFQFGDLVTDQDAVLDRPGGCPVEHAGAVVLHLRRYKVEVPGLVVRDADVEPVGPDSVTRPVGRPDGEHCGELD